MNYTIESGEELTVNQTRTSPNGLWVLKYRDNGNLVLFYKPSQAVTWSTHTEKTSVGRCVMKQDGNLVVYDASGVLRWNSETNDSPGAWCNVQDDGNFVIYAKRVPNKAPENLWDATSENQGGMVFCLSIYKYIPQGKSELLERKEMQVRSVPAAHRRAWAAAPPPDYEYRLVKGRC